MAPGPRHKFGAPVFEPEVFREQTHCIEESACDIVGTFRRPHGDSPPGKLCPSCPHLLRRWMCIRIKLTRQWKIGGEPTPVQCLGCQTSLAYLALLQNEQR